MYSTPKIEEKITKELLGPHHRHTVMYGKLYPQSIPATKLKYNSRKPPSDLGSSGPVTPCETPGVSLTQMEEVLLRSSRGVTFAKIARRNPQGWQKIVKAQLEHEKFLNSMRFYDRMFLDGSDEPLKQGPATFQNVKLVRPEEQEKQVTRLKSFQIPWKRNTMKSNFVSPAEQKKIAFKSLKDVSGEPPQTPPPEVKTSKDTSVGQLTTDKNQNINQYRKKDAITRGEERKPYASLVSNKLKPLPLRVNTYKLSVLKKTEKIIPDGPIATPILFTKSLPRESYHNQMQAGLLSRAERVNVESHKNNFSISDSMRSQFSLSSRKFRSSSYYQILDSPDPQSSNSQEPGPSNSQQQSSNFQISQFSSNSQKSLHSSISHSQHSNISHSQKSQGSSETSSNSKGSLYLRRRLLKEAADQPSENNLQEKLDDAILNDEDRQEDLHLSRSSSFSNVTAEMRKPRMYQKSPLLPVFIQSPYYKRMSTDDREYIKELQRKLDNERAQKAEADKITQKMYRDF